MRKKLPIAVIARPTKPELEQTIIAAGHHPLTARVLASRCPDGVNPLKLLSPPLTDLDNPESLPDIERAAMRIALAVLNEEVIGCCCDFDVDGSSSGYLIITALTRLFGHPDDKVIHFVSHRLTEGYGVTEQVAARILAADPKVTLVITADQGSSDNERIERLKAFGIDTIVTDHHGIPSEGPPKAAYACVSPARPDSRYPDPTIAGCMVAFLVMCIVRQKLIRAGYLPQDAPNLYPLLGAVAAATVADCVDLRSINNRAVITAGLRLINRGTTPAWAAFKEQALKPGDIVTAETLGFKLGPAINSRSRVDDPRASVKFLTSPTKEVAEHYWNQLVDANEKRKEIEKAMTEQALDAVFPQVEDGRFSIVYYGGETFSPGVHGIVASRMVEAYGRPTVLFSPHNGSQEIITGSARTVEGCHVKNTFDRVRELAPDIIIAGGGHRGAGGLKIHIKHLHDFRQAFEQAVREQVDASQIGPRIITDGELDHSMLNLGTVDELAKLEPYGREFPAPLFQGTFTVASARAIGDGTHCTMALTYSGISVKAVWFRCIGEDGSMPVQPGATYRLVFGLKDNVWQGKRSLQLMVCHARPIHA